MQKKKKKLEISIYEYVCSLTLVLYVRIHIHYLFMDPINYADGGLVFASYNFGDLVVFDICCLSVNLVT